MENKISRRESLKVAASLAPPMALLSAMTGQTISAEQDKTRRALPIILIYLDGGADNKGLLAPDPDTAPKDFRGPFASIETNVPGMRFSENMPKTAKHADRMSIIRSVYTGSTTHGTSAHNTLSGGFKTPIGPHWGKATAQPGELPYGFVYTPESSAYSVHATEQALSFDWYDEAGVLDYSYDYDDPDFEGGERGPVAFEQVQGYHVSSISNLSDDVLADIQRRVALSKSIPGKQIQGKHPSAYGAHRDLATSLYTGGGKIGQALHPKASRKENESRLDTAIRLKREADYNKRLELYGGSNCVAHTGLLCARLVESGARFVTFHHVHFDNYGDNWDDHGGTKEATSMKAPALDAAIAGLITEIRTGAIEPTLVVIATDFDRTPKMNRAGGRDHWNTGTLAFAAPEGHAIEGGSTYGKKTHDGYVTEDKLDAPQGDVVRTIMHAAADGLHDDFIVPNQKRARKIMLHKS